MKENNNSLSSQLTKFCNEYSLSNLLIIFIIYIVNCFFGIGNFKITCSCIIILSVFLFSFIKKETFVVNINYSVLLSLLFYNLISIIGSFVILGSIFKGYPIIHLILPIFYLILKTLNKNETFILQILCVISAGLISFLAILKFLFFDSIRLSGIIGNANAMGIFIVMNYFLLLYCLRKSTNKMIYTLLISIEPLLLIALSLTLSMGSFLSMILGFLYLVAFRKIEGGG